MRDAVRRLRPRTPPAAAPRLSVIVPVCDEEASLPLLYERLTAVLAERVHAYEIIAVDDGSCDGSFRILRDLAARDPRLCVLRFRRNFGQTAALAAGFAAARGRVIVTIDADLQADPADIPALLAKLGEGWDVVSGWRERRSLPSRIANPVLSWAMGVRLRDYGCSLKAYRAEVVADVERFGELDRIVPAIATWQSIAVTEIPVRHAPRHGGRSKYRIDRTVRLLLDLVRVRFLGYRTQVFLPPRPVTQ